MNLDKSDYYPYMPGQDPETSADTECNSGNSGNSVQPEPEKKNPSGLEKFVSGVSHLMSWVFVPLLVPVYGTIMILTLSMMSFLPSASKIVFTLAVVLFNVVVPMVLVLLLKRLGMVKDIGLNNRSERPIPYIIMIICFGGTALFFHIKGAPLWMTLFYAGGAVAATVNLIINIWWKISAHAAAMAGLVALLMIINRDGLPHQSISGWLIATVIATGLLGSARVWLGRHTVGQVMAGYLVGFLSIYLLGLISSPMPHFIPGY